MYVPDVPYPEVATTTKNRKTPIFRRIVLLTPFSLREAAENGTSVKRDVLYSHQWTKQELLEGVPRTKT